MKIVYIYTALVSMGGVDRVIATKANYLSEKGYDVSIITDSQTGRPPIFPLSPSVKLIDLDIDFSQEYNHCTLLRAYWYFKLMKLYKKRLIKLLSDIRPDIIISTFGRDAKFVDKYKRCSKAVIAEVHTTKDNMRAMPLMIERGGLFKYIAKYIKTGINRQSLFFDDVVVLNEHEKELWSSIRNVTVIENSLPFYPDSENPLVNKSAIFVGRAEYEKGPDRLIDVWKKVAGKHIDWNVRLFSVGTMQDGLKSEVRRYNLEKQIVFNEPNMSIENEYMKSSICISTSRYEGFGLVLIEAMACGVPCVAYDCPYGPRGIIRDGEDGFLIPDGDIENMVEKVNLLIENEHLRKAMGAKAKQNISRLSKDVVMKRWIDLFDSLVEKHT